MDLISNYKPHPNVIIGDDDELFLSGGAHHVEDFILGIKQPKPISFDNFNFNIKHRQKVSEDIGAEFIHMVCPDKQTAYASKYPIKNTNSLGNLYKKKCEVDFLYPVENLKTKESYFKTDSHWNPAGALIATKHILDKFNISYNNEKNRLSLRKEINQLGDLGAKLTPPIKECVEYYEENLFKITYNNEYNGNDGLIKLFINPEAQEDYRLLIFGDSFMMCCLTYFSDIFKYVIFVRSRHFHPELVYSFKPTHIISSNVERYLSHVDTDKNASNIFLLPFLKGLKFDLNNNFHSIFSALTSSNTSKLNELLYMKLQELIRSKDYKTVERITRKMMLKNYSDEYLYLLRSRNFMASGQLDDGLTLAISLVEKSKRSAVALEHLASCYLQRKEFSQALSLFDEAIDKNKDRYVLYKGKSVSLRNLELNDEALKYAKKALELSNSSPDVEKLVAELETICRNK